MKTSRLITDRQPTTFRRSPVAERSGSGPLNAASFALFLLSLLSGCAAFRPINAVPARYLPEELRGRTREEMRMIDLSMLKQRPVSEHIVDSGDSLAIYIEGVLGQREQPPINNQMSFDLSRPPTLGYPLTVRDDGTLSLPLISPIVVRGKTIPQVEDALRYAYTIERRLLQPGRDRILVSLHQPRTYHVLVVRQEDMGGGDLESGSTPRVSAVNLQSGLIGSAKRGNSRTLQLPAYKNDVLNALVESGGLPGLNAQNVIYVIRSPRAPKPNPRPAPSMPTYAYPQPVALPPSYAPPMPTPGVLMQPSSGAAPFVAPSPGYASPSATAPPAGPAFVPPTAAPATNQVAPMRGERSSQKLAPIIRGQSPDGIQMMSCPNGQCGQQPFLQSMTPPQMPAQPMFGHNMPDSFQPPPTWNDVDAIARGSMCGHSRTVRIPLRLDVNDAVNFTEQDVILEDGDIIFIEGRLEEMFYTGGLLGGGQYTLPRDQDIDILEAIAIAQNTGGSNRDAYGKSALNQDVTISASEAIVIRKLSNGSQMPIRVDLYRARLHPSERINIQPGDYVMLQYKPAEAVGAFVERHILETALFGAAAASFNRTR